MNKIDRKIVKTAKWIQNERNNHIAAYWGCNTFQKCKSVARAITNTELRKADGKIGYPLWDKTWKTADRFIQG